MTFTHRKLAESAVYMIRDYIKANIASALSQIRTERNDPRVTTEPPPSQSYFIYPGAKGYRLPAVFIICERMDFYSPDAGANFVHSKDKINVSVVIEDRMKEYLMIKAWRYQAALHGLLERLTLTSADNAVKLIVRVDSAEFSPMYSSAKEGKTESAFKQEVVLTCEVEHYEAY